MTPKLKLEWLAYFDVLARSESFQQAARELFITQQALSNYLLRLEQRLGVVLIDRDSQGKKELTPEGEQFLAALQPVLAKAKSLQRHFQNLSWRALEGTVRLAIQQLWMSSGLGTQLQQMQAAHPEMLLRIVGTMSEAQMLAGLLDGELDIAILTPLNHHAKLAYLPLFYSPCVMVSSSPERLPWNELPFIRYLNQSQRLDAPPQGQTFWSEERYPRKVLLETNNLLQAIEWCQRGLGALYLPRAFVEPWLQAGLLHELGQAPEPQEVSACLVWNPELSHSPAHEYLIYELGKLLQVGSEAALDTL